MKISTNDLANYFIWSQKPTLLFSEKIQNTHNTHMYFYTDTFGMFVDHHGIVNWLIWCIDIFIMQIYIFLIHVPTVEYAIKLFDNYMMNKPKSCDAKKYPFDIAAELISAVEYEPSLTYPIGNINNNLEFKYYSHNEFMLQSQKIFICTYHKTNGHVDIFVTFKKHDTTTSWREKSNVRILSILTAYNPFQEHPNLNRMYIMTKILLKIHFYQKNDKTMNIDQLKYITDCYNSRKVVDHSTNEKLKVVISNSIILNLKEKYILKWFFCINDNNYTTSLKIPDIITNDVAKVDLLYQFRVFGKGSVNTSISVCDRIVQTIDLIKKHTLVDEVIFTGNGNGANVASLMGINYTWFETHRRDDAIFHTNERQSKTGSFNAKKVYLMK